MSAAHTPAPWKVKSERVITANVFYTNANGEATFYDKEIAWTQPIGSTAQGSRIGNARIIAAAPDMFEELEMVDSGLHMLIKAIEAGDPSGELRVRAEGMKRDVRAAIAKALGRTPNSKDDEA